MTCAPIASVWARIVGLGGAAATVTVSGRSTGWAAGSFTSTDSTAGAPQRWVTPSASMSSQMRSPRTARRHTCRPPAPTIAHGWHQPLQWNIGSVHRYTVSGPWRWVMFSPSAFRYAPRWVYITPFGSPVVPDV